MLRRLIWKRQDAEEREVEEGEVKGKVRWEGRGGGG